MNTTKEKKAKSKTVNSKDLPLFIKEQFKIIDSLQQRINQLNRNFEIEKKCKNQAYYYILDNGHLNDYIEYVDRNPVKY